MLVDEILVVSVDRNLVTEKDVSVFLQGFCDAEEFSLSHSVFCLRVVRNAIGLPSWEITAPSW